MVIIIYADVRTHYYINLDDDYYAQQNPAVQSGLSVDGVRYAFTALKPFYWQPLTWLSLELDTSICGNAAPCHLAGNVLLHAASAILLFLLFFRTTGALWPSAFTAALWAVHPLRVESVAWVAERKDVLSTFLFIATLFAYARFVAKRSAGRYATAVVLFVLALMAKPMVVVLPFALLLFDVWPLRRKPTVIDKVPLAILALVIVVVTFIGQETAIAHVPVTTRFANAVLNYVEYLGKFFFPVSLAAMVPYRYSISPIAVAAAIVLLIAITIAALRLARQRPYIAFGWLWFLITIVPVIGIVQSGPQSMADRFSYIPTIGLTAAVVWAVAQFERRAAFAGAAVVALFAGMTIYDVRFWRDSISLFGRALEVTKDNTFAHLQVAEALRARGSIDEANRHYAAAMAIGSPGPITMTAVGAAYAQEKRYAEGIPLLERAVAISPNYSVAHEHLGLALLQTGRVPEAFGHLETAMRLDDGSRRAEILQGLGNAKRLSGHIDDGIADLRASIDSKPTASAWNDLAAAYSAKGDVESANQAFVQALRLDPNLYDAHMNYAAVLSRAGRNDEAAAHIREAMRLDPKSVEPVVYLALVDAAMNKKPEAATLALQAQQMDARAANDVLTRALHMPPKESNLDEFIVAMNH